MTNLFNGHLKNKFKTKLPNQDSALRCIARGCKNDDTVYEETVDETKVPLPTALLCHEMDTDLTLQDTILGLCDKDGMPLKWKYLADNMKDVMELLKAEDFFDQMPMTETYNYYVCRDWMGVPVSKYEIDSISRQRKIFEKRAMLKRQQYERRLKNSTSKFIKKNVTIDF